VKILIPDNYMRNVRAAIDEFKKDNTNIIFLADPKVEKSKKSIKRRILTSIIKSSVDFYTIITSPFVSIEKYLEDIIAILKNNNIDVVMPFSHASVDECSYGKTRIEKFSKLIFPDFDTLMKFHDKWQTYDICRKIGVPFPKSFHPKNFEDLVNNYKDKIEFPCIVKIQMGCGIRNGVRKVNNWLELEKAYKEITSNKNYEFLDNFERPIIQEFVKGKIHDVVGVFKKGEPVGIMSQIRYITYPIEGGTGSVNITTHDHKAIKYMKKLMKEVRWTGPAMGEFIYVPGEDDFKLIELNPKFWGTLALALSIGFNFPKMAAEIALGKDVKKVIEYPAGYMYRWSLTEEVKSLTQYKSKLKAFGEYIMRTFRKNKSSEFSYHHLFRSLLLFSSNLKYIFKKTEHYRLDYKGE